MSPSNLAFITLNLDNPFTASTANSITRAVLCRVGNGSTDDVWYGVKFRGAQNIILRSRDGPRSRSSISYPSRSGTALLRIFSFVRSDGHKAGEIRLTLARVSIGLHAVKLERAGYHVELTLQHLPTKIIATTFDYSPVPGRLALPPRKDRSGRAVEPTGRE